MKKTALIALAAAFSLTASAFAQDFGRMPANYEAEAEEYLLDRLVDPRAARFEFSGSPYRVYVDVNGYEDLACWAIDVRVRASLPGGSRGSDWYTVVFYDGRAIALDEDTDRMVEA